MRHAVIEEDLRRICGSDLPWSAFAGKTVLIAGANGFLPAYMVETLLYLNEIVPGQKTRVIGLVRDVERAAGRFDAYRGRDDLKLVRHDVTQPLPPLDRPQFIIHAASQASPKYFGSDPAGTLSANVLGTHYLLQLASDSRAEGFFFFSSGAVYGRPQTISQRIGEQDYGVVDPLDMRSCYAESKRLAETMCVCWWHQFGVPVKIARVGHTYGPGMRLDDGRVTRDFVADVIQGRPLVMRSDGAARRAFCYLADATAAFFAVLLKGVPAEAYNIANDEAECTISELANLLVSLFPERHLQIVREGRSETDTYLPGKFDEAQIDISKIKALGWRPTTGPGEGFLRTVKSFE